VVGSPLHCVVDFPGCRLLQRLVRHLVHFPFGLEEYGTIFYVVVGLAAMEHALRRSECVWASATSATTVWRTTSLVVLSGSLVEDPLIPFLQRCPKVLLPILWWSTAIRINTMHWLGVAALIVVVAESWGFIWL
jgi:hypothetical protein